MNDLGTARLHNGLIVVSGTNYDARLSYAGIAAARWNKADHTWEYPMSVFILRALNALLGPGAMSGELREILDRAGRVETHELRSKTQPWACQKLAYDFMWDLKGGMLALEMGVGKTKVAIDLLANRGADRVLIVCPRSVIPVWPREFAKHSTVDFRVLMLRDGLVAKRAGQLEHALTIRGEPLAVVVNYEAVWREPIANIVMNTAWDYVVADEVHRLKAPGGKQSIFMSRLRLRAKQRLGLTGTPLAHSPLDAYGQYRFLDPGIFGTSFVRFRSHFAIMGGFQGKQVVGFQNEAEFSRKFYSIAVRVMADDVLDLPEATDVNRYCELSPEARKIYKSLEKDFYAEVQGGQVSISNALTKLLRLQQITSGYVKKDDGDLAAVDTSKLALFLDVLDEIPPDEPVVVFCRFWADMDAIAGVCDSTAELSGRRNDLESWQCGDKRILIAQIQAGSEGNDFTRSRYQIYFSVGFSLTNYQQSRRRILRPGQMRKVLYVHLIAEDTVDEKVYKALQEKRDIIEYILGLAERGNTEELWVQPS